MSEPIHGRKAEHLALCATGDVGARSITTLLECVRFVHNALPDLSEERIDTGCTLFGKRLKMPVFIAAMTGGTEEAGRINRELAKIAEERGLGFGLGSQRAMLVNPGQAPSFQVRSSAPRVLLLGNLGVVQAAALTTDQIRALIESVGADAICIHLSPAMELVQPGGDRDFSNGLKTIERLRRGLSVPVIVKETGSGISPEVGSRLRQVGVEHVDVSGAGGTSWVGVETKRAEAHGDHGSRLLGEAIWDWGIPTGASVALLAPLGFSSIIATGGVGSGLDVARAIALGATAGGIARPVLKAFTAGGAAQVHAFLDGVERELRAVMLLTGSPDLAALRSTPRVIIGQLRDWLTQLAPNARVRQSDA